MSAVNIFTSYRQEENHFTNGLVSILSLSRLHTPEFLSSFLQTDVGIAPVEKWTAFAFCEEYEVRRMGSCAVKTAASNLRRRSCPAALTGARFGDT